MNRQWQRATVWVTGAGGLIGSYIAKTLADMLPDATVVPLTRSMVDLLDLDSVKSLFHRHQPALVVHCAAMSRSPECEANPELARKINIEVTRHLAQLAARSKFVFFSSDLVFDGRKPPYNESSAVNPLSVYAETKVVAENLVLEHPEHLVIRTSLNGGASPTGDRGFNEQMRLAWQAGRELTLFTDEFRSPIHAMETARAVSRLALLGCSGLYHVAGGERLSRWDLGLLVVKRWPQLNPRMRPGSLAEYKGPPRPADLELVCEKAASVLGAPIPGISDWLLAHPAEVF